MPTAAGTGAIPSEPPAVEAAGKGATYTPQAGADDIRNTSSLEQIHAIVKRVRPRPSWYTSEDQFNLMLMALPFNHVAPAVRQWLREDALGPLENPPPPLDVNLRGGRRRKKTRAKRKHFRKRTSRRT